VRSRHRGLLPAASAADGRCPGNRGKSIGPVPQDGAGREHWSRLAGRVEAYREHWGIQPEDIRNPPIDGTQYQEWNAAVKTLEMIERINQPHLDHGLERGLGIEL
jgi:hypothetical protein